MIDGHSGWPARRNPRADLPQRYALKFHGASRYARDMQPAPDTIRTNTPRVVCDGSGDIPGGAALGHPRVFLEMDDEGFVDCGYCDRRFVLIGGSADRDANA
jgi:NADH dehydrogenase (ubiquinone) Fe-S protein 6